jgi:hypothetical protein
MKIKKFNELNEGILQYLKPKSKEDIMNSFKIQFFKNCDSIIEYINNMKNKHEKGNVDIAEFCRDVAEIEIIEQIAKDDRYNFNYNTYYSRRTGYLMKNLGLKNIKDDDDYEEE